MTKEQRAMLTRINEYAEKVMPDIDPQKTPISYQLDMLTPIMKEIGEEQDKSLSDIFIEYMDLASEAALEMENKLQESLKDIEDEDKK
ncbi:MAG: hypothetical protein K5871_02910 [Lachnospiraceae bacterium]|nr:hypothetical protein [Lachnospiraceae bacterium]